MDKCENELVQSIIFVHIINVNARFWWQKQGTGKIINDCSSISAFSSCIYNWSQRLRRLDHHPAEHEQSGSTSCNYLNPVHDSMSVPGEKQSEAFDPLSPSHLHIPLERCRQYDELLLCTLHARPLNTTIRQLPFWKWIHCWEVIFIYSNFLTRRILSRGVCTSWGFLRIIHL